MPHSSRRAYPAQPPPPRIRRKATWSAAAHGAGWQMSGLLAISPGYDDIGREVNNEKKDFADLSGNAESFIVVRNLRVYSAKAASAGWRFLGWDSRDR